MSKSNRQGKIDLREGGEAAATVFGKYDREQELRDDPNTFEMTGAAGSTSKQLSMKQPFRPEVLAASAVQTAAFSATP